MDTLFEKNAGDATVCLLWGATDRRRIFPAILKNEDFKSKDEVESLFNAEILMEAATRIWLLNYANEAENAVAIVCVEKALTSSISR